MCEISVQNHDVRNWLTNPYFANQMAAHVNVNEDTGSTEMRPLITGINSDELGQFSFETDDGYSVSQPEFLDSLRTMHPNMTRVHITFSLNDTVYCGCFFPFGRTNADDKAIILGQAFASNELVTNVFVGNPCDNPVINAFLSGLVTRSKTLAELSVESGQYLYYETIVEIAKCQTLRSLHIAHCVHMESTGIRALADLPQLRNLNLHNVMLDRGDEFGSLRQLQTLTNLWLCDCNITSVALQIILKTIALEKLCLDGCKDLTDAGFVDMAACRESLVELSLRRILYMTDETLKSICLCARLKSVDLLGCPLLTPDGLRLLTNMQPAPTLLSAHAGL